jgi:tRNA(Ile)-lysidine synthase
LLDRVSGTLSRYSMCPPGSRVAIAVSGGADSVCLLCIMSELAPSLQIELSVAHLNHGLRGRASDDDAEFVRELAGKFALPFHYKKVDIAEQAGNLEQAGRNARLAFFENLNADRIATGHTKSDQAETVLYRLLRGSGTAGLAGVLPVVGRRIRPLIDCTREEVLCFLQSRNLEWREDATNADRSFARNKIRHDILPLLDSSVTEILARTAELARDEEEYWDREIARIAAALFRRKPKAVQINAESLSGFPRAVQRRLIRQAILEVKGDLREIGLFHVEALLSLASQYEGHGRVQAPGIDVFRSFEWLQIGLPRTESRFARDYCLALQSPGITAVPGQSTEIRVEVAENTEGSGQFEEYNKEGGEMYPQLLDIDRLLPPFELRNWHPGDQFTRSGHSSDKIKTLFQLARIPIWERQGWPVITCEDRLEKKQCIVWTRKFGVSSQYGPVPGARRVLRIIEQEQDSAESNDADSASVY